MKVFRENSGEAKPIDFGNEELNKIFSEKNKTKKPNRFSRIRNFITRKTSAEIQEKKTKKKKDWEDETLDGVNLSCANVTPSMGKTGEYGNMPILLENRNYEQCRCHTFIPTGIFQYDWIYFRKCFQNFKDLIITAENKQLKEAELVKTFAKEIYMAGFYSRFGGEFQNYRNIMMKFSTNYHKICRLNRSIIASNDGIKGKKIIGLVDNIKRGVERRKCLAKGRTEASCSRGIFSSDYWSSTRTNNKNNADNEASNNQNNDEEGDSGSDSDSDSDPETNVG